MLEFIREKFNFTPISFVLVSNQDHLTPVSGAPVDQYLCSINGNYFLVGNGSPIREVSHGCYNFVLGSQKNVYETTEQDNGVRLISIPGVPGLNGYDPVSIRVLGDMSREVSTSSQDFTSMMTFLMVSYLDHVSPVPDLNPVVNISRNGSAFQRTSQGFSIGMGFYYTMVPTLVEDPESEFNNECIYLITATDPSADPSYDSCQVFRYQRRSPA